MLICGFLDFMLSNEFNPIASNLPLGNFCKIYKFYHMKSTKSIIQQQNWAERIPVVGRNLVYDMIVAKSHNHGVNRLLMARTIIPMKAT